MADNTLHSLIEEASKDVFEMLNDPQTCLTKPKVLNAYCGLCKCGVGHCEAIKIASRLLKLNTHASSIVAEELVECWVFQNSKKSVN